MTRATKCHLEGGPRHGQTVTYRQPLPETLVLSSEIGYVDYARKPGTTTYVSADQIPSKQEQDLYRSLGLEP